MKNRNKVKQKWIAQILVVVMILTTVLTAAPPQQVSAAVSSEVQSTVTESTITSNVASGSAITLTTPIRLSTTAGAVTGAAIKFKVNDGVEQEYINEFTLGGNGVSSVAESATVTAYTYLMQDAGIRSGNTTFTYTIDTTPTLPAVKDLFFSEYVEGSSNNKAIEIYNGTGVEVNLSNYSVYLYSNGTTTGTKTALSGTLAVGDVFILYNASASDAIKSVGNLSSSAANYNGDDALELRKGDVIIDVFGKVGERPVPCWSEGEKSTLNKTLVRKAAIQQGNTTFSLSEWDQYDQDTITYLGNHTTSGGEIPVTIAAVTAIPNGGEVLSGSDVQLQCVTTGAAIWYKSNGGDATEYTAPITITENTTIEAYATKDSAEGPKNSFVYTIGDGETTISEARAIFSNPAIPVKKATVTGIVTFIDGGNVFMQDATAGIDVYFSGGTVSTKPEGLAIGKELTVTGDLTEYKGLLEITKLTKAMVGEAKNLPEPKLINLNTIDAAGLEAIESQRIRIEGVTLGTINTGGDTPITSSEGKTLNLYRMPALTEIVTGDLIDVIGVLGQYTNYQLRVADKAHVTKSIDHYGPIISMTNPEEALAGKDYRVIAVVTDSTGVKEVKLSYDVDGVAATEVIMVKKVAGQYEYIIPAAHLKGTKLNLTITAVDTMEPANISTNSMEKSIKDLPRIVSVLPEPDSNTGEGEDKPSIVAVIENAGETPTIDLKVDNNAVLPVVTTTNGLHTVTYNTPSALSVGEHSVTIMITRQDLKTLTYTWSFYVGKRDYNVYFGQIHSHTTLSDGAGEVEDAFAYAAKTAENLDFLAITDHSNSLEEIAGTNNIANATNSTKWIRGKKAAADITAEVEGFVGIYAYEMTWSGGSIGHMNTYNTPGFENRNNAPFKTTTALKTYFDALKTQPGSISMFNHPGDTFGDFGDFSNYDTEIDKLVTLIEVGNGEGLVRESGYFPSYEFYTRALDKGWHLAPANNQDNHKGKWGDANTARTVILATELTEEGIYDAMRDKRVYASEDNNLSIRYTLNNNIMGSILADTQEPVNISVELEDTEPIGKVEIVVNGGMVAASKDVSASEEIVSFTLPSNYSYYYVRITQMDKDIAVTAPVWVGEVEKCGISKSEVNKELALKGEEIAITTSYYNNETLPMDINKLEYSINGSIIKTMTDLGTVPSLGQGKAVLRYTSQTSGSVNIDVKLYVTLDGVEKVFTDVVKIVFYDPSNVTKVLIDGTHFNDYVYGYYSGNMTNFTKLAAKEMTQVEVVTDAAKLTSEALAEANMLIITVPARWAGYLNYESKPTVVSPFSVEYISMVKEYVDKGGNIIICGISDREDRPDSLGTQASTQINKLLAGIGSTTRINSDEGTDFTTNSGQEYRLHFKNFNMASPFLEEVVAAQQYSMYKGCSVLLNPAAVAAGNVEWLVKGHSTTETKDIRAYDANYVAQTKGEVVVLASEKLAGGGFMLVGGSVFMSNFEVQAELDNFGDLQYANYNIILNAVKKAQKDIVITPIAQARKGTKGEVYTVEGTVTAGTETGNAFFDTIYIQDLTGGIDIFPVNEQGIKLGLKVRVTGTLAEYENDLELMVMKTTVLDTGITPLEPKLVTTAAANDYAAIGGELIKVKGVVTKIVKVEGTVSYFLVKDSSTTPIRVFINGYIGSRTGVDPTLKLIVGDTVTAVGLSSMDTEGVRIRVRDRAEITIEATPPVTPQPDVTVTPSPIPTVTPAPTITITSDKDSLMVSVDLTGEVITDETKEITLSLIKEDILKQIAESGILNLNISLKLPEAAYQNPELLLKLEAWILQTLKNSNKNLMVSMQDKSGKMLYTWNFAAEDLAESTNEITDVNLFLSVDEVADHEELAGSLGTEENTHGLVINFGHHGTLPSQSSVRIYVGDRQGVTPGGEVILYYYNSLSGKLETLPYSTYVVDQDGYITIQIVHCSDYVVLPEKAPSHQITSLLNQISILVMKKILYVGENTSMKIELPSTLELVESLKTRPSRSAVGGVVITYQSTNKKVATVDKNGNITAKGVGKANIITSITLYSGKTKIITTGITIRKPYLTMNTRTGSMKVGETFTFEAKGHGIDMNSIQWTSLKKGIVIIDRETGLARAESVGTDYVVATIGDVSIKWKVVVK
jgi:predicted extracellular nuclease